MRNVLAVAALTAVVVACAEDPGRTLAPSFDEATPAEPGNGPVGACPAKFDLAQAFKVTKDMRYVGRDPADDNQDRYFCIVVTKDPVYNEDFTVFKSLGVTVLIDNDIPPEKVGKCPLTFTAATAFTAEEDYNQNSVVCKTQSEEEGLVIVDDNDS